MKRSIATAAVCGVSLFGFTAVAGAAGNPPNPNPAALNAVADTACVVVPTHNPTLAGTGVPGSLNNPNQFDSGQVGMVFCGL
jgi:hypothetical protein